MQKKNSKFWSTPIANFRLGAGNVCIRISGNVYVINNCTGNFYVNKYPRRSFLMAWKNKAAHCCHYFNILSNFIKILLLDKLRLRVYLRDYQRWSRRHKQGCKSLLSIGGDNLQFYPNFSLFSTLGGMSLDHYFFQESKLSEEQKKVLHQKWNTFFPEFRWRPKKRSSPKMEPGA